MTAARVTQQAVEVLHSSTAIPNVRVTQQAVEVLHSSTAIPNVRVTQQAAEVLHSRYPKFSGVINESLAIEDWLIIVVDIIAKAVVSSGVFSGNSYSLPSGTVSPCLITIAPKFDYIWSPSKVAAIGDRVVASNPDGTPHLFKVTTAGTFASTESSWNLSGTTTQGTAVLTYVAPLVDPVTIGPKIPG
ncbi:MAG: hypothetical protein ACXV8Q_03440 [Methylobacter sp.]